MDQQLSVAHSCWIVVTLIILLCIGFTIAEIVSLSRNTVPLTMVPLLLRSLHGILWSFVWIVMIAVVTRLKPHLRWYALDMTVIVTSM